MPGDPQALGGGGGAGMERGRVGEGREAVGEEGERKGRREGGSGWSGRLQRILEVPAQGALLAQGGSQPSPQA